MRSDFWNIKDFRDDLDLLMNRVGTPSNLTADEAFEIIQANTEAKALFDRLTLIAQEKVQLDRRLQEAAVAEALWLDLKSCASARLRGDRCGLKYLDDLCLCLIAQSASQRELP